jgi:hypothetical protein
MDDHEDKENNNIHNLFSKRKNTAGVTKEEFAVFEQVKKELRLHTDEKRITELVRGITMAILNTLDQEGFTINDEDFKEDMTMSMEYLRSALFRQVGLSHIFHEIENDHNLDK